jgi:hypothetical protein
MDGRPVAETANFVVQDNVFVYGFNGVVGDDFRLYYPEQAANHIVPQTTYNSNGDIVSLGSPVAGLTNAETLAQFGIAFGGAIAPADFTIRPGIIGLVAPMLAGRVNDGGVQRSMVTDVYVQFGRLVNFPNGTAVAFQLTGPNGTIPITVDLSQSTVTQTIARLRFPNGMAGFGSLADGNYTLTVVSTQVMVNGQPLDGDGDGQPGGNFVFGFYRLFGDVNGDRYVDAADLALFRFAFGSSGASPFDFDSDNVVSVVDFQEFRSRFGTSI